MVKFKKTKAIARLLKAHTEAVVHSVKEITKKKVKTAEEASMKLRKSATVLDMYDLYDAIEDKAFGLPATEYTEYAAADHKHKIIQFNGQKADFLSDEETLKVFDMIDGIDNIKYDVLCIRANYKHQYFVLISEGKNGNGDFVDDDMRNILKVLDTLKEKGATWRSVTDLSNDIIDDLSSWVITFTVE